VLRASCSIRVLSPRIERLTAPRTDPRPAPRSGDRPRPHAGRAPPRTWTCRRRGARYADPDRFAGAGQQRLQQCLSAPLMVGSGRFDQRDRLGERARLRRQHALEQVPVGRASAAVPGSGSADRFKSSADPGAPGSLPAHCERPPVPACPARRFRPLRQLSESRSPAAESRRRRTPPPRALPAP